MVPTAPDPVRTEEMYGSLAQLVVLCEDDIGAFSWGELGTALSDMVHPLTVDILSTRDVEEDAEASIQAYISTAAVRLHTIIEGWRYVGEVIGMFWKQTDGAGMSAGHTGSD